jgi:CheY-like chemotaxis protein
LLVKAFLGRTPHRLEEVVNGRDAVERVTSGGVFDLVLMDVEMPEMNGYEATRAIRAWERESSRARLPIVALTAHGEPEERERSAEAGCDAHVLKPIRKALLLETIATYALAPRGGGAASEGPP